MSKLSYKTAKRLKDAGFSQKGGRGGRFMDAKTENDGLPVMPHWEGAVYCPTLSELIEACGDEIDSITRYPSEVGDHELDDGWQVKQAVDVGERPFIVWNDSLEEAVALLWIEVNQPKDDPA